MRGSDFLIIRKFINFIINIIDFNNRSGKCYVCLLNDIILYNIFLYLINT